jgi:hypothetical protein
MEMNINFIVSNMGSSYLYNNLIILKYNPLQLAWLVKASIEYIPHRGSNPTNGMLVHVIVLVDTHKKKK